MKIVNHEDVSDGLFGCTITMVGGPLDGQEFKTVKANMDDGSTQHLWICNTHKGYFKHVFVPWDFEHEKIIE